MREPASSTPVEASQEGNAAAVSASSALSSHDLATPFSSAERRLSRSEQSRPVTRTKHPSLPKLENSEIENAATILEFLAWGRRKDPDYNEIVTKKDNNSGLNQSPGDVGISNGLDEWWSDENWLLSGSNATTSSLPFLQPLLPSRQQLVQVVDYHRECLLWYHG